MNNYFARSIDAMGKFLRRSNAMGSILVVIMIVAILCGISMFCSLKLSSFIYLTYFLVIILGCSVLAAIGIFIYFALKNPRVLQSEQLQITMRQMDLAVATKGSIPYIDCNFDNNFQIELCKNKQQDKGIESNIDENAIKEEKA